LDLEFELFKAFGLILFATLSLGFYLGKSITAPIVRLANEADKIADNKILKTINLPEFKIRKDEIGDLARSFSKMTNELQSRINYISDFTADVAHELKNPITSLRSASETIGKIKDLKEQKNLIKVIQNDVQRIDRLINDISAASRLDAELSRIEMTKINLVQLLNTLIKIRATTVKCKIKFFKENNEYFVIGNENRIAQVFDNLIQNAVSFSKKNDVINIRIQSNFKNIIILVEDYGPGFPSGALKKIFNRFYTERPSGETFGNHSGLGLSISKQIIEAHGGSIEAFNRLDSNQKCNGATVKTIFKKL
jgi:two-component system sensor histidine kinase ChvG